MRDRTSLYFFIWLGMLIFMSVMGILAVVDGLPAGEIFGCIFLLFFVVPAIIIFQVDIYTVPRVHCVLAHGKVFKLDCLAPKEKADTP